MCAVRTVVILGDNEQKIIVKKPDFFWIGAFEQREGADLGVQAVPESAT